MNPATYTIHANWDSVALVWVATSKAVPGLVTEAKSIELLVEKLQVMVPELLKLNGIDLPAQVPFELVAHRSCISSLSDTYYEADEGPLDPDYLQRLRAKAMDELPSGQLKSSSVLFDRQSKPPSSNIR